MYGVEAVGAFCPVAGRVVGPVSGAVDLGAGEDFFGGGIAFGSEITPYGEGLHGCRGLDDGFAMGRGGKCYGASVLLRAVLGAGDREQQREDEGGGYVMEFCHCRWGRDV